MLLWCHGHQWGGDEKNSAGRSTAGTGHSGKITRQPSKPPKFSLSTPRSIGVFCAPMCACCWPSFRRRRLLGRMQRALAETKRMEMEDAETSLSAGSGSSTCEPPAPHSEHQPLVAVATKRRSVPRRGHTKSKSGCTSCKRRRVKCDEGLPTCGPCRRLALDCEYAHQQKDQAGTLVRASPRSPDAPARPLRTTPGMLEMTDLRFFHHFLLEAYPPLPILGREIWQHVSQMSHQVRVPGVSPSFNADIPPTVRVPCGRLARPRSSASQRRDIRQSL